MKAFKKALFTAAAASILVHVGAHAQVSYNMGVVSLYKSNGVDQNSTDLGNLRPAVQGGVDYDFGNGLYVGNWNSTGRFISGSNESSLEIDLYGGYRGKISESLSYDLAYAHYYYPRLEGWNSGEMSAALTWGPMTVKLARGTTTDVNKGNERFSFKYDGKLSEKMGYSLTVGTRNKKAGSFEDYAVGVSYDLGDGMTSTATVMGTSNAPAEDAYKTRFILGVSKAF